jgi:N-acyl-D-amino-acid deacylase
MTYDLLIKSGRVMDGTGSPWFAGDVGVKDGKIAAIGQLGNAKAKRVIDAKEQIVAPGFIDNHCHFDAQVTWDPLCTFSCYNGVTTVVIGNCSLGLAPVRKGDGYMLNQMLSRVEAIPMDALEAGVNWRWNTIEEYMEVLDSKAGVNICLMISHSAVRRYVMGDDSQTRVQATPAEIAEMKEIIRAGMYAGAAGVSFTRNQAQFDDLGKPLPSLIAPAEELVAIAELLGEIGMGTMQLGGGMHAEMTERLCSKLAEVSGRPVFYNSISQHPGSNDWREQLDHIEQVAKRGLRARPLLRPVPASQFFTLRNAQMFDQSPTWKPIMLMPKAQQKALFANPEVRKKLWKEAVSGEGMDPKNTRFSRRWDLVTVVETKLPKNAVLNGKSIKQIAEETNRDVLDVFLDLALEEDLETTFQYFQRNGDPAAMAEMLRSPYPLVGDSDSGAHVVFNAYYGYASYFFEHWIRKHKVMSWEEGVRKMTAESAEAFGIHDRGILRVGLAADIVVFDPDTIAPSKPEEVKDFPAGAGRMKQVSAGILCTVINGEVFVENGEHTGAYPGQVTRNALYIDKAVQRRAAE